MLFFEILIRKYGFLSHTIATILTEERSYGGILKTGSQLYVFTAERLKGLIVNILPKKSAEIWKYLYTLGVPVAPFLKAIVKEDNTTRVFSRFCGSTINDLLAELGLFYDAFIISNSDEYNKFYYMDRNELVTDIYNQIDYINAYLDELGILHGHPHQRNFTYELVDDEYLEQHLQSDEINWYGEIQKPNINNFQFDADKVSFDITKYNEINPSTGRKKWRLIVRLIDWDQAKSSEF